MLWFRAPEKVYIKQGCLPVALDELHSVMNKKKAFVYGVLSVVVEPIASVITILLTNIVIPILPYLLSFAAGAMIYVVIEELVPEMHEGKKSEIGVVGFTIGFLIMMILDIALG